MTEIVWSLRNYRCFGDEPVNLHLRDGFTAIVGANNSGKSTLIRSLYECRGILTGMREDLDSPARPTRTRALDDGKSHTFERTLYLPKGERIHRAGHQKDAQIFITIRDTAAGSFLLNNRQLVLAITIPYVADSPLRVGLEFEDGMAISETVTRLQSNPELAPLFEALKVLEGCLYIGPFRNAVTLGDARGGSAYFDMETGSGFVERFAEYKSGNYPEHNEAVYSVTQTLARIYEFEHLDINASPDRTAIQLTIDGLSYRLPEIGAGFSHFILTLINSLVRRPTFVLIDEPELNLHASLQLQFLTALAETAQLGVIFATHSLGLARTAADTVIVTTKLIGQPATVRDYGDDRELVSLLGQLSFDRTPNLGFSQVLLVEGKTELRAIAQILRLYKLEHHVLLIPLHGDEFIQGSVGVELSELKRLGGPISYLIDSERTIADAELAPNRKAFVELCTTLAISGHVLERRALENYFTTRAIQRIAGVKAVALGEFDKHGRQDRAWAKAHNWRIARQLTRDELDATDLGRFLQQLSR